MKLLLAAVSLGFAASVSAQEFKPYPKAPISEKQWRAYFDQVKDKHRATEQTFPEQHLISYTDASTFTQWAFTIEGHKAHPAVVTRRTVELGGKVNVQQIGYFAGAEEPFAKLFREYQHLNEQLRQQMQQQSSPPQ